MVPAEDEWIRMGDLDCGTGPVSAGGADEIAFHDEVGAERRRPPEHLWDVGFESADVVRGFRLESTDGPSWA